MENANFNSGGTGANLFAGGAEAGQAASQVDKSFFINKFFIDNNFVSVNRR